MQTQTLALSAQTDAPALTSETWQPTTLDYKTLLDRTSAALQEYGAGRVDAPTFRRRLDEIQAQSRAFDLLLRLQRTRKNLAGKQKKPSPRPASS